MTYFPTRLCSIIGAGGLNCRVRHGAGWDPTAMNHPPSLTAELLFIHLYRIVLNEKSDAKQSRRAKVTQLAKNRTKLLGISTARLHTLLRFHLRPI